MRNRISVLLLVVGLAVGYFGSGTSVTGQVPAQGPPLVGGDTITLIYQQVSQDRMAPQTTCVVLERQGTFVKCDPGPKEAAHWINLAFVVEVIKYQK